MATRVERLPGAVPTRLWSEKHRGLAAEDNPVLFMLVSGNIVSIIGGSTSLSQVYCLNSV